MRKFRKLPTSLMIPLLLVSLFFALPVYSEGFKLKKVGSHYEPELIGESITLPDTEIRAGTYKYISDNVGEIEKLGFLVNSRQFYFVQSNEYSHCDEANYGVNKGYFVIDGWGYGSVSGHNRLMFLFRYDKDYVRLLDVIGQAYVASYGMDFVSITNPKEKRGYLSPLKTDVKDVDGNGRPEIKIEIYTGDKSPPAFELYLEIVNDRLQVNFNSKLYKPLFENVKRKYKGKIKPVSYYVYGFLMKRIGIERIKTELAGDKDRFYVVKLLENVDKWNSAFHDLGDEKFELLQYNLSRR